FEQRQALHLTTIGSIDVGRRARKELRKRRDRLYRERKRRAAGTRPRTEYEANSLSKNTRPIRYPKPRNGVNWEGAGEHGNAAGTRRVTQVCRQLSFFLVTTDLRHRQVKQGCPSGAVAPKKRKRTFVSRRRPRWLPTYMQPYRWN